VNGAAAVARYTVLELSRRRVLLAFFLIGAAGIALLGVGLKLLYQVASSNQGNLGGGQVDPGTFNRFLELLFVSYLFQALAVFALLLAYGIGMTAIYHDLESGSAVSIFSKPVSRLAFTIGKIAAAVGGLVVIVGLLAVEARIAMLLFGGGLENALTGQLLATVANSIVIMLIVLGLSAWVNNILAAVITFIYYNVVTGIISSIHLLADGGVLGNDIVRSVFDVLYWLVPHQLISSAVRELAVRQIQLAGSNAAGNQAALASVPAASGAGDILWWGFNVVLLAAVVYWAVRRRQV
jgi:ABC-type transport system involved in multi-copper enzyme maturation permease subunit